MSFSQFYYPSYGPYEENKFTNEKSNKRETIKNQF